ISGFAGRLRGIFGENGLINTIGGFVNKVGSLFGIEGAWDKALKMAKGLANTLGVDLVAIFSDLATKLWPIISDIIGWFGGLFSAGGAAGQMSLEFGPGGGGYGGGGG